jgi:hypothetical protein
VQEVIGQGGMGVVLKAFEPALHRLVAIKVLSPALAGSATARLRFTREAKAAAAVSHDHVVVVHGVHETEGLPYLVMKYVAGESLQERLDRAGPLELTEIVRIGLQTACGLAAAHKQGLIHRDIKPANLLLENGLARVTITDFGLARTVDDVGLTQNGVVAGTPEYMAPEQARGEAIDHRADLFSLGSVLYAMSTGMPPFRGSTTVAVLRHVCEQTPPPVRSLNPDVPEWLDGLIARLMAKDPADRFQSAAEVAELLEAYLAHLREPATKAAPWFQPAPRIRRKGWAARLLLLCLALALPVYLLAEVLAQPAAPPANDKDGMVEVYQDFRHSRPLLPSFYMVGPDHQTLARPEDGGLRITLPAEREPHHPISVQATLSLSGDFEVTGTYEILAAAQPAGGYGAGVSLNVANNDDRARFAKASRVNLPREGSVYCAEYWARSLRKDYQVWTKPTEAHVGKLRLVRTGPTIRMLVAEGADAADDAFQEIYRVPHFGAEDLGHLRFEVADSGQPGNPVDARLLDLKIRCGKLVVPGQAGQSSGQGAAPGELGGKSGGKGWLVAALLVMLGLGASSALVWGLQVRARRRRTEVAPAERRPRLRGWLLPGALVTALAVVAVIVYAVWNPSEEPPAALAAPLVPAQEAYWSLKGEAGNREAFDLRGPSAEKCVKFEPEGLRITLPAGWPKQRPMVGVNTDLPVQGNFEITVSYEILREPDHADGVNPAMKLWLMGVVNNHQDNPAVVGRIIHKSGEPRYTMWQTLWDRQDQQNHTRGEQVPTRAKSGRLRLVRTGTMLRYYAAEGADGEFQLLQEFPFTDEDLKGVRILCSTGDRDASLDVRVTDLRVRAGSALDTLPPPEASQAWVYGVAGAGVLLFVALAAGLGLWVYRRRAPASAAPAAVKAEEARLALRCSGCERKLKVKPELAGKKVKCPGCGAAVPVPSQTEPRP